MNYALTLAAGRSQGTALERRIRRRGLWARHVISRLGTEGHRQRVGRSAAEVGVFVWDGGAELGIDVVGGLLGT